MADTVYVPKKIKTNSARRTSVKSVFQSKTEFEVNRSRGSKQILGT